MISNHIPRTGHEPASEPHGWGSSSAPRGGPPLPQWIPVSPAQKREEERRQLNCSRIFPSLAERLAARIPTFFDPDGGVLAWDAADREVEPEVGLYLPAHVVERREALRRLALAYEKAWAGRAAFCAGAGHDKGLLQAEKRLRRAKAGRYACPLDRSGRYFEAHACRTQKVLFLFEWERENRVDQVPLARYDNQLRRFLWNVWHSDRTGYDLFEGDTPLTAHGPAALIRRFILSPAVDA